MMLMTNDVAQRCHGDPIDPIRACVYAAAAPRRRVLADLLRRDGAAEA